MQFLVDECTGPKVAIWLREQGYSVFSVYDGARGTVDKELLHLAFSENRILITNDKDFGDNVFKEGLPHRGIILLRLEDERSVVKIRVLEQLLKRFGDKLVDQFTVASENKVRFIRSSFL